jgi:hypothetical protein
MEEEEYFEKYKLTEEQCKRYMELKAKCIKCENEIKRIDFEEDIQPKKGEYIDDMSCGCAGVEKGIAPGILVELINPSLASISGEEEDGTFHGYMCDGCLQELRDKKIIEDGPEKDKEELIWR